MYAKFCEILLMYPKFWGTPPYPPTHPIFMLAPTRIILAPAQNQFLGAPAALPLLILRHFCIITIGGHDKGLLNSSEYRKESSWALSPAAATQHSPNGHWFHRKHYQLGTVFWWISRPERRIILPRNPASSLLRPWFPWPQMSPSPDLFYLVFLNIDFGLWMSRRFPIEVWSDPDTSQMSD